MDEIYALVLTTCTVLLAAEVLLHLFPEKSGKLIHSLAVLLILASLLNGVIHSGVELDLPAFSVSDSIEDREANELYTKVGTALLKERLAALLDAADIDIVDADDIEIWYTQDDEGAIEIDRVRVCVKYSTDTDRAFSVLRSVLTEAIPVEIYAE